MSGSTSCARPASARPVTAARSCSRRRPAHSLGNELPERVSVRDLGEQHLKDVQHEHVYELSLDESTEAFPPLKATGEDREEAFEQRFEDRINRYVEEQLEASLSGSPAKQARHAAGGLVTLVLLVAAIVAIVLLIKLAF